jgi:hypothetical protein
VDTSRLPHPRVRIGPQARAAARIVVAGLALLFLFTLLFVGAFHAPRAKGIDVGVVGTPAQAAQAQSALDTASRGAYDVRRYDTEAAARDALLATDVHGVAVPGVPRDRILIADAQGLAPTQAVTEALRGILRAPAIEDLRPLPDGDRRGLSPLFTVLGTLMPSLLFGIVLSLAARSLPARLRVGAVIAYAVLAGAVVSFNVDVVTKAMRGDFAGIALVGALLALAVSGTAHGLARVGGPAGIAVAAVVLLVLGVSTAGGAVTYEFEPGFYGAISQLLPPGAALTAVRNVHYFDWAATLGPLLVLAAWSVCGLALVAAGERLRRPGDVGGAAADGRGHGVPIVQRERAEAL